MHTTCTCCSQYGTFQTDSVHPFQSDGLCLNCKRCPVQSINMGYTNFRETIYTGRSIFITPEETGRA